MVAIAEPADPECVGTLQEVAELYAAQAVRVRNLVRLRLCAPEALVEDACQIAWMRLVRNRERVRRRSAAHWLVQVAANEALRQIGAGERDLPLERLTTPPASAPDLLEELADSHERLGALRRLPERQRRLVWLQGLGFSYAEMASATGDSRRTVERQLARARKRLAGV
ncbi:MAG TPA: sigma-70 family RNA polymerase sigma factor [Solirubrobacteraceae bacterium]|nr:sigma-70 family RNA polymerase sigma factor [Solirubrobacteraceae bacterium]